VVSVLIVMPSRTSSPSAKKPREETRVPDVVVGVAQPLYRTG
jgi:hypothetical protein